METMVESATWAQAIEIREMYRDGMTRGEVARHFNIEPVVIYDIINEKLFRSGPFPEPIVPRNRVDSHPEGREHGYHQPTNSVLSFAKHPRYSRTIAQHLSHVKFKTNDGRTVSRRREIFIKECVTKRVRVQNVIKIKTSCKKNLSNNKGAMFSLQLMIKDGRSNKYISDELFRVYGHRWSNRTIARLRSLESEAQQKKEDFENKAESFEFSPSDILQDTQITNAEAIKGLQDDKMSAVETQVILKSRGIHISIPDIEMVRSLPISTQYDPAKIIDECMEILVPLWENYKVHNVRAPDGKFWSCIHPARDRYRQFHEQIDSSTLSNLALLGYEALEYLIETNTTDRRLKVFWKPLFAKWYHAKYPGRNRNNGAR